MSQIKEAKEAKGGADAKDEKLHAWEESKSGAFAVRSNGGTLEFRFKTDEQALAVASRLRQVLDESAYLKVIQDNPTTYQEGEWVIFHEGREVRHVAPSAQGTPVTRAEAMQGMPPGAFCTRFSKEHLFPSIRSVHIP